ncbi:MAG TPA: methyltransferase domain-containing protein [Vicinamibacterales bacterium]|nr:methyltransferase domain-containing protein [Vicinamibacterales bacterium]HPW19984.1 methyltransferase domain-containing protein [Vicinamibacterales bacterium]
MARDSYRDLAAYYDLMASDPGIQALYREWRGLLLAAIRKRGLRPRVLVDLACGTGNSTIPWTRRRGWTVVGVDRSAAMLRAARRKSRAVRWVRQDLTALRLGERADLVTCHFDALNHVLRDADLQRVFDGVGRLLREGGLFQFDLNTAHWLRRLSASQRLFRLGPHAFTAYNAFDPRTGVALLRQLWFVKRGRHYRKLEVAVRERAYDRAAVRRMLRQSGLRLVTVRAQRALGAAPIRDYFLAVRLPARPAR